MASALGEKRAPMSREAFVSRCNSNRASKDPRTSDGSLPRAFRAVDLYSAADIARSAAENCQLRSAVPPARSFTKDVPSVQALPPLADFGG